MQLDDALRETKRFSLPELAFAAPFVPSVCLISSSLCKRARRRAFSFSFARPGYPTDRHAFNSHGGARRQRLRLRGKTA